MVCLLVAFGKGCKSKDSRPVLKGPSSSNGGSAEPDTTQSGPNGPNPTDTGGDTSGKPAPDKDSKPDEVPIASGWSLTSPKAGSTSTDTSPQIMGGSLKEYTGGKVKIFADSACAKLLAEAKVSDEGTVRVTGIRYKANKSDDGLKAFYAIIEGAKNSSKCADTKLFYSLDTDKPFAGSRFVRATFKADPATTMNIGFDARNTSKTEAKIFYGTEDHGRDTASYTLTKTIDKNVFYKGMYNAFSQLSGLKADTTYYFVIKDAKGVSPVYSFRTLPDRPDVRLSIIAGGDSRNNRKPRQNANLLVAKIRPHVVLFGGDMTNLGSTIEWIDWFEDWEKTMGADGRLTPVVVTRGNHELTNSILVNLFDITPENYYALSFGGNLIRAYTLNTEASIAGTQTEWLTADLKAHSEATWRISQYHTPMRPHVSDKSEGNAQYQAWAKVFFDLNMDLVIESDAHTVKITWPLEPSTGAGSDEGFKRNDAKGTVYLGEGCWGAPLRDADDAKAWTRDSGSFNHFNWLFVDQSKLEIRTIKVDNAENVGSLDEERRFEMPSGLDVWTPKNGSMITLKPKN